MPTLLIKNGLRFFFVSGEPKYKVPHVHVEKGRGKGGCHAIFWLETHVKLQKSDSFKTSELFTARSIIIEHQQEFLEKYYELINPKHKSS